MATKYFNYSYKIIIVLSIVFLSCSFFTLKNCSEEKLNNLTNTNLITLQLIKVLDKSIMLIGSNSKITPKKQLQAYYFSARKYYKQIETIIEYCAPFDVKYFINGALVKKSDIEIGNRIVEPHGFQVIEEQLFSVDTIDQALVKSELQLLQQTFVSFNKKIHDIKLTNSQIIEAMQFELIRLSSMSLSGFDATMTKTNNVECAYVLLSFKTLLSEIKLANADVNYLNESQLITAVTKAQTYCLSHPKYDTFDRLFFITEHIKSIYKKLVELHQSKSFPVTPVNYAINLLSKKVFETESYNLNYFSVNIFDTLNNSNQAKLGEFLFFDPILSGNNLRACASCHNPNKAFTDGLKTALAFDNQKHLARNSPTLLNTIFQRHFFYDGSARQLEQQINDVLHNKNEMNSNPPEMIEKLNQSNEYQSLFKKSYKGTIDTTISYYGILKAISEYEKTLISMNSRFDKYIRGDKTQLSKNEMSGYNLFSGKALCGSCHFFPLFNGLVPPIYNDTEYEVIGVPESKLNKIIDNDEGRIKISKSAIHKYAFKTPTVRNSSLTAPYMHNGIYNTLDEVLEFYNKGGGQGIGINISHQTLPFDSLKLTKKEMADIKSFIISLSDTIGLNRKPKQLPKFNNESLNNRVIGGSY